MRCPEPAYRSRHLTLSVDPDLVEENVERGVQLEVVHLCRDRGVLDLVVDEEPWKVFRHLLLDLMVELASLSLVGRCDRLAEQLIDLGALVAARVEPVRRRGGAVCHETKVGCRVTG